MSREKNQELLPIKAAMWFTICNIVLKGTTMLSAPLFTRFMTTEEYGTLSMYISSEQILMILATWDLSYGAYARAIYKWEDETPFLTGLAQGFTSLTSIIFIIIIEAIYKYVGSIVVIPRNILWIFMVYAIVEQAYRNWVVRKQKDFKYKPLISASLIYGIMMVVVPFTVVRCINNSANAKYVSGLIVAIVFGLPFYAHGLKNINDIIKSRSLIFQRVGFIIKFELPCIVHSLSLVILGQSDRIMIGNMIGSAEAAYYSVAYILASAVQVLQNSLEQARVPWMFKQLKKENYGSIKTITNYLLMIFAAINLLFIIVAPEIFKLLFTEEYYKAVYNIPPVACGVFFCFLYQTFTQVESYYEKTNYIMYVSVVCSILNILLNFIGIPIFGYLVCGYTTLISYIFFSGGHYFFLRKICKERGIKEEIFELKAILSIGFIMIVATILIVLVYPYIFIRYMFVILGLTCLCIKRKKIFSLWNQIKEKE